MSERMADLDAAWLHMERPDNLMVVNVLLTMAGPLSRAQLRGLLAERVLPVFRRFSQTVDDPALTLGPVSGPAWVDEPELDVDDHLHARVLPSPGDDRALRAVVDEIASTPLPAGAPLWEMHLLTGHAKGCAVLLRTHHALADGAALQTLLLTLTDPLPGEVPVPRRELDRTPPTTPPVPGPIGRVLERAADTARAVTESTAALGSPVLAALVDGDAARDLVDVTATDATMLTKLGVGMRPEPNMLQGPLSTQTRFGQTAPVALSAVTAVSRAAGATVNDVLLGVLTSALRRYLQDHDALVDEVVVILPIDQRDPAAPMLTGLGNDFGLVFLALPTGLTGVRLHRQVALERMCVIKGTREATFTKKVLRTVGRLPARVQNAWIDTFAGRASAVVTNVVGPPRAVTVAGTQVRDVMVWAPMIGPVGVGVSFLSYAGRLRIGLATDAELVPDHDDLLRLLDLELARIASEG